MLVKGCLILSNTPVPWVGARPLKGCCDPGTAGQLQKAQKILTLMLNFNLNIKSSEQVVMMKLLHWTGNLGSYFQVFLNVHLMLTWESWGISISVNLGDQILIPNTYL